MSQESSKWRSRARWLVAFVAAVGLFDGLYLVVLHAESAVGQGAAGALCNAHSALDCESALNSGYAELFGIPIALLGVSFYAAVLALTVFDDRETRESSDPFRPAAIAATTFGVGLAYSIILATISVVEIGSFCPLCSLLYVVNLFGVALAGLWAGEAPHRVIFSQLKRPREFFNGWTGLFAIVFGVSLLSGTLWVDNQIRSRVDGETPQVASGEMDDRIDPEEYRRSDAPAKGPTDAEVHVVEFASFTCSHCRRLAGALDEISDEYGDSVRIEYRYFPPESQQRAQLFARAAHCANEQGAFWGMHHRLYLRGPLHSRANLREYAQEIGVDEDELDECIDSGAAHASVDRDVEEGNELEIRGTPTIFVNGRRFDGALPYERLVEVIDEELE